jgi:hypothetical protein
MRLISQSGKTDLPYERYVLRLTGMHTETVTAFAVGDEEPNTIGKYSSEEDARFAMLWVASCYINESRCVKMPSAAQATEMRKGYEEKRKDNEPLYKFLRRVSLWQK